mmetsp:Transcript_3562/g.11069  ORF Transcript_3562/g.11069 Transcript_3562/m.11069 type:complete len:242 (+) Transcript_3562:67-792(+)
MAQRQAVIRSGDSPSLWNATLSPGWTIEETQVLRQAIMKWGFGRWKEIVESRCLPHKTPAQLNLQAQRMVGQQSLGEFMGVHLDCAAVFFENAKRTDVKRKNGMIINTGKNPTPAARKLKIQANIEKYGIPREEYENLTVEPAAPALDRREKLQQLQQLREHAKKLEALIIEKEAEECAQNSQPAEMDIEPDHHEPTAAPRKSNGKVTIHTKKNTDTNSTASLQSKRPRSKSSSSKQGGHC